MSGGGPPHHPHNRHVPPANSAWNHLPVPGYFPRQPQVAHMQAEHSLLHQASWHTPTTTDAMKLMPHSQMLNEMFKNEALFTRDCVDLSLTRNGNQNGELPSAPSAISLSVRDTSKINSLPSGMLDIQAMELTKCVSPNLKSAISPGSIRSTPMSPGLKAASPGLLGSGPVMKSLSPGRKSLSPAPKPSSPGLSLGSSLVLPTASATISSLELGKNQKRSNIRVDSILERLNPIPEKTFPYQEIKHDLSLGAASAVLTIEKSQQEKPPSSQSQSVIVSAASNYDENSNSSGTTNVPTPKEEDSASMHSNEDSLDSTKSRRKRKPSKTIRVTKEDDIKIEKDQTSSESTSTDLPPTPNHKEEETTDLALSHPSDPAAIATILEGTSGGATKLPDRLESSSTSDELEEVVVPAKTRRKASSESETIDNIAAMVQEGLKEKGRRTVSLDEPCEGEIKVEDELDKVDFPAAQVDSPAAQVDSPGGQIDSPALQIDSPALQIDSPECKTEETVIDSEENKIVETMSVQSTSEEMVSEDVTSEEVASPKVDTESVHSDKHDDSPEIDVMSALSDKDSNEQPKMEEDIVEPEPVDAVDGVDRKKNHEGEPASGGPELSPAKPVTVSVIKTKENLEETLSSSNDDVSPEVSSAVESTSPPILPPVPAPLITPAQKKASITHFVEVENKLEEMFAGIVEEAHVEASSSGDALESLKNDSTLGLIDEGFMKSDDSLTPPKQEEAPSNDEPKSPKELSLSPKEEVKKEEEEEKKTIVKKPRRSRPASKREGDQDGEVPSKKKRLTKSKGMTTPTKKPSRSPAGVATKSPKKTPIPVTSNKTPTKLASSDVAKDICFYDSGSNASSSKSRGPFVQIRGPRDSPLSVSVVNTPLNGDEDGERKIVKNKKFHDDSEYRHKVRSKGLHCSTLSTKYDAERKDATWICAFCKRGPHASELSGPSVVSEVPSPGDLFGPYFITSQCPEFEKRLDDPFDRQFKSRKISKVLDATAAAAAAASTKGGKKTKRKSESAVDPTDVYLGITDTGNNTYEVWLHEDCLVWSAGVYLVGPKVAGLEEAVWTCSNLPCAAGCGLRGANVSCVKRGCLGASHLCCARKAHWRLDEANFKAYCPDHSR